MREWIGQWLLHGTLQTHYSLWSTISFPFYYLATLSCINWKWTFDTLGQYHLILGFLMNYRSFFHLNFPAMQCCLSYSLESIKLPTVMLYCGRWLTQPLCPPLWYFLMYLCVTLHRGKHFFILACFKFYMPMHLSFQGQRVSNFQQWCCLVSLLATIDRVNGGFVTKTIDVIIENWLYSDGEHYISWKDKCIGI
jgi:hypothetical protein